MNKNNTISLAQLSTELALQLPVIKNREQESVQMVCSSLKQCQRNEARQWFDVSLAWNELHQRAQGIRDALNGNARLTYVVDAWFLQDLVRYLTPNQDEEITYVTGVNFGPVKILSRICGVTLEKQ